MSVFRCQSKDISIICVLTYIITLKVAVFVAVSMETKCKIDLTDLRATRGQK
jgi:hypothetical protein